MTVEVRMNYIACFVDTPRAMFHLGYQESPLFFIRHAVPMDTFASYFEVFIFAILYLSVSSFDLIL